MNRRGFLLGALAAPIAAKIAPAPEALSFRGTPIIADAGLSASTFAELNAITLRAFVPKLIITVCRTSPILALMRDGSRIPLSTGPFPE